MTICASYIFGSFIGNESFHGASTSFFDVRLEQYNGVEVCVEQGAIATTVAGDTDELCTDSTEVNVGVELNRSTVREPVVSRRTTVVVSATAISWRCRPVDHLVLAVIQLVGVVQRQSCVVDAEERALSEPTAIATHQFTPVWYTRTIAKSVAVLTSEVIMSCIFNVLSMQFRYKHSSTVVVTI